MEPTFTTRWFYSNLENKQVPLGRLTCAVCGLPMATGALLKKVLRKTFTDHAVLRSPAGNQACAACEWYFGRQDLRRSSWWLTATEARPLAKSDVGPLLRQHLEEPPQVDGYYLITIMKRKHLALYAPLNMAGNPVRRVRFEVVTLDLERETWLAATAAAYRLRQLHSWKEVQSDDYKSFALAKWISPTEFVDLRQVIRPWLGTPLIVKAELMSPVIFDRWQPLDGILAAASIEDPDLRQKSRRYRTYRRILRDRGRNEAHRIFAEEDWPLPRGDGHFMPLAVWSHGHAHGLWVYASSCAIPAEHENDLIHFARRVNFEQVDRWIKPQKKRVYTAKGEFASKYIPFQTTATASLTWHVLGIREEIEEILTVVRSIGKKRRRGYGTIRRWTVKKEDADRSVFTPENAIMRPIPVGLLEAMKVVGKFEYAFTTYRPPYWKAQYATKCAITGTRHPPTSIR